MTREKVIKGLECLITDEVPCNGCPYEEQGYCPASIARDALELLKEQEPKNAIIEGTDVMHIRRCPSCKVILHPWCANYCHNCGQEVKQDEG